LPAIASAWSDAEWISCRDGKSRQVEPGTFPLLDGISTALVRLRAIEDRAAEDLIQHASASKTDPNEALRMVRQAIHEKSSWQEPTARMRLELPAPEILLAFLLCLNAARETEESSRITKNFNEVQQRFLRSLRQHGRDAGASRGWESAQPHRFESADAVLALSFVLARHAQAYEQEIRNAHATANRVGMLKGFGNAIVPQVAAEFIRAYLDVRG
jgi:hypothetical protein